MSIPFYINDLQPADYAGFQSEYHEWLALVADGRDGGQVASAVFGSRADASLKGRRAVRRLFKVETGGGFDGGLVRAGRDLGAGLYRVRR